MPTEQLTYTEIASRLGVTSEAARAIVKRHRLPRSPGNDGKVLVSIDLADIRHKPLPARSPRSHQPVSEAVTILQAKIQILEAELAAEQQRSAGHRADFERERARSDHLMSCLLAQTIDLMTVCEVTARLEGEVAALRSPPKRHRWWQRRAG